MTVTARSRNTSRHDPPSRPGETSQQYYERCLAARAAAKAKRKPKAKTTPAPQPKPPAYRPMTCPRHGLAGCPPECPMAWRAEHSRSMLKILAATPPEPEPAPLAIYKHRPGCPEVKFGPSDYCWTCEMAIREEKAQARQLKKDAALAHQHGVKTVDVNRKFIPLSVVVRSFDTPRLAKRTRSALRRKDADLARHGWAPDGMKIRSDHAARLQAVARYFVGKGIELGRQNIPKPSAREMGSLFGISHQTGLNWLKELHDHGVFGVSEATIDLLPGTKIKRGPKPLMKVVKARRLELVKAAYPVEVPVADSPQDFLEVINLQLSSTERPLTDADLSQARRDLDKLGYMTCLNPPVPELVGKDRNGKDKWRSKPATWVRHEAPVQRPYDVFEDVIARARGLGRKRPSKLSRQIDALLTCPDLASPEMEMAA